MKSTSPQWHGELQLTLQSAYSDLVRAFVREAALAEGVPVSCASLIADDSAEAWLALSAVSPGRERAHIAIVVLPSRRQCNDSAARKFSAFETRGVALRPLAARRWNLLPRKRNRQLGGQPPPQLDRDRRSSAARGGDAFRTGLAAGDPARLSHRSAGEKRCVSIAHCFQEVYGHHYVHSEVFSPRRYWTKVESGEVIPVVARGDEGEVIGHVALEREPGALVAERGEAVVLPAYRGQHLLERMTERLSIEAPKRGLHGIYAEPLTIHTFSQRNDERAGMPVCAVLLGANPESFRPKDIACPTAGQRQSYLRTFRFVQPPAARDNSCACALPGNAAQYLSEPWRDGDGGRGVRRGIRGFAHRHEGQ